MENNKEKLVVQKANQLVTAKYRASAMETKLMAIGLTRLEITNGIPKASVRAGELRTLFGNDDHNIYRKLKGAAAAMVSGQNQAVIIEDGKGNFTAFTMITKADYTNQVFTITFNSELTPYISSLKGAYTSYELENILKFDSNYTIRLYEILKKEAYRITKSNPMVSVEYDLAELKNMLGALKVDQQEVYKAREKGESWEQIEKRAKDKTMSRWGNFKERVLERAKVEIAEQTDIRFDYEPIRMGRGAGIKRVIFNIWNNDHKGAFPVELHQYIDHNGLTKADLQMLYQEAGEDVDRVIEAIYLADKETMIHNYVGWLRSCIREEWKSEKIETLNGSKESADFVRGVRESVEEAKKNPNDPMFIRMWANMQSRPEYEAFMEELTEVEKEYFEYFDYSEKVDRFLDWKKNR